MINVFQHINRYRMRDPQAVVDEMLMLHHDYGVETFKFTDELFLLNKRHVTTICEALIANGLGGKISAWVYGRPDCIDNEMLSLIRRAGIDWIALGIESGAETIRDGADKSMSQAEIIDTVRKIESSGIAVIANYIFGLPGETMETMERTLEFAQSLNTAFANFYPVQAFPGSQLYDEAVKRGLPVSQDWRTYSMHNEFTQPLPMDTDLTARQILQMRDDAFDKYFTSKRYLDMAVQRFGWKAKEQIERMTAYKLKRQLLENKQ